MGKVIKTEFRVVLEVFGDGKKGLAFDYYGVVTSFKYGIRKVLLYLLGDF